jgi:hypothetical protein
VALDVADTLSDAEFREWFEDRPPLPGVAYAEAGDPADLDVFDAPPKGVDK